jgi:hypothetical protein
VRDAAVLELLALVTINPQPNSASNPASSFLNYLGLTGNNSVKMYFIERKAGQIEREEIGQIV